MAINATPDPVAPSAPTAPHRDLQADARESLCGVQKLLDRLGIRARRTCVPKLGTNPADDVSGPLTESESDQEKSPAVQGFSKVERAGLEPATPSLQSWCSPN